MKQLRDEDKIITQVKHIHMIGIGGSGMYPIVQILASRGYNISGSDVLEGDIINYQLLHSKPHAAM